MKAKLMAVFAWFAGLFSKDVTPFIQDALGACAPYTKKSLEVCKEIAAITPNRSDDELIAAMERFDVKVMWGNSAEQRADALRHIALKALQRAFPDAAVSSLNLVIEIAVGTIRRIAQ